MANNFSYKVNGKIYRAFECVGWGQGVYSRSATNLACAQHSIQETCYGSTQPPGTCQIHMLPPSSALWLHLRTLPNALYCLPGNDLRQHFQDVGGQSTEVFGEAHEAWGQGDGLPMQQHLVGSADGGTHPRVGQPKACFGNLLHPFLHAAQPSCNQLRILTLVSCVGVSHVPSIDSIICVMGLSSCLQTRPSKQKQYKPAGQKAAPVTCSCYS